MTTGTPELPGANICVEQSSIEAACAASNLQVPVGGIGLAPAAPVEDANVADAHSRAVHALTSATIHVFHKREPAPPQRGIVHSPDRAAALTVIVDAAVNIAVQKNVHVKREHLQTVCAGALIALDDDLVFRLLQSEPHAAGEIAAIINRMLDMIAATQVLCLMWQVEGFEDLDVRQIALRADVWIAETVANDMAVRSYRWPNPDDMACAYYAARSGGPVGMALPFGVKPRAVHHLDRKACRVGSAKPASRHPLPLLIRCPGLPGTPGAVMPDGRRVQKFPDGHVVTSYWRDGKLHRDDGPAWHRVGPMGERTEYRLNGGLHRPHKDGPALIDTNLDGKGIHALEYYENDKPHRPAHIGPGAVHADASGSIVFECYAENGIWHRDPAQGPAGMWIEDGIRREHYYVQGSMHRDEREGPARMVTDILTGEVIEQGYYRHGEEVAAPAMMEHIDG